MDRQIDELCGQTGRLFIPDARPSGRISQYLRFMTCYCVCFTIERCKSKNILLLILFLRDTNLRDLRLQAPSETLLISQMCTTPYPVSLSPWPI
jgi:hypothetical protein